MSTFWSDASLEPKRKYRFRLTFGESPQYVVTKVKNPAMKISETPHKFLNHTFYYPGRAEWDPIDISFVDPGGQDDTSGYLWTAIQGAGYEPPSTEIEGSMFGFTKAAMAGAKGVGNVVISQLGILEQAVELEEIASWTLFNPFFTNITWGEYDYNGEEMLECSCTIRYDYAEYSGAVVGSTELGALFGG